MDTLTVVAGVAVLIGCAVLRRYLNRTRAAAAPPMPRPASSGDEAEVRKARSVARMEAEGVRVNPHLPVIEDSASVVPRPLVEVAERAMALLLVASRAEGLPAETVGEVAARYGIARAFTPAERAFLAAAEPTEQQRTNFLWRNEAAWVLLWALGYVPALGRPASPCDAGMAASKMAQRSRERFLEDAELRPFGEILDEADLIYRYRWASVDARLKGIAQPPGVDASVALERHHALNWLVRYGDDDWDDISTDT